MATHNTRPRKASSTKKDASSTPSANTDATTRKKSFRNATHAAKSKDAAATEAVSGDDFLASAKALYRTQLKSLRELFSSTWNDDDLVSVLQEVQGDLDVAIARISEGYAEHWSTQESKKTKKDSITVGSSKKTDAVTSKTDEAKRGGNRPQRGEPSARGRGGRGRGRGASSAPGRRGPRPDAVADQIEPAAAIDETPAVTITKVLTVEEVESGWNASGAEDWGTASVAATIGSESHASTWDDPKPASASGWADPLAPASRKGGASLERKAPPPTNPASSKSTWAQIARPAQPKPKSPSPAPIVGSISPAQQVLTPRREPSPSRPASTAAAATDLGILTQATLPKEIDVQQQQKVSRAHPPGFANAQPVQQQQQPQSLVQPQQQVQQRKPTKPESGAVVMPTNATMANVGVKFGSLSLQNDAEAMDSHAKTGLAGQQISPSVAAAGRPNVMPQAAQPASYGGLMGMMPGNEQTGMPSNAASGFPSGYGMAADFPPNMYGDVSRGVPDASAQTSAGQQGHQGPAYPMNAANLANMYAAYFPYYMNQFPGTNPYGQAPAPAAGFGHQAFNSMNKYPMYPNANAPNTTASSQMTQSAAAGGAKAPQSSSNPMGNMYGGYNPYYQQAPPAMDDPSNNAADPYKFSAGGLLNSNPTGASKSSEFKQDKNSNAMSNAPYYNQYMHPSVAAAQYQNFVAPGGYQQAPMQPPASGRVPQQQSQQPQQPPQPYWSGTQ